MSILVHHSVRFSCRLIACSASELTVRYIIELTFVAWS